jgi:hypothetical protein
MKVSPLAYVRITGEPANTEHESPLEFAVAQLVFAEPGPGGKATLNTRFGCDAKVRKVLASAAEGGLLIRSLLLTYIPSPVSSGPPVKLSEVPAATFELHPFPSVVVHPGWGRAAGSLLKIKLVSDAVTVPVDPVSSVLMTVAEAFGTKSKLPTTAIPTQSLPLVQNLPHKFIISPPTEIIPLIFPPPTSSLGSLLLVAKYISP